MMTLTPCLLSLLLLGEEKNRMLSSGNELLLLTAVENAPYKGQQHKATDTHSLRGYNRCKC